LTYGCPSAVATVAMTIVIRIAISILFIEYSFG
jgi:hypothetical protein